MNRVEENHEMIVHFAKSAMETGKGTYEEMVNWHLGAMNSFLMDISKSLAIIADSVSREDGERSEVMMIDISKDKYDEITSEAKKRGAE